MVRLILSVLGGLLVAFAIVFAADALFHALSSTTTPSPDPSDKEAMRTYVASQPFAVLAGLIAAWAAAVLTGAALAARSARRGEWPGWLVTAFFILGTAANFLMVTHPTWMVLAATGSILLGGWLGSRIGATARQPAPAV